MTEKRGKSGEHRFELDFPYDDRMYAIDRHRGAWSTAAAAAVLAMPHDTCDTVGEWDELVDGIDRAIEELVGTLRSRGRIGTSRRGPRS